MAVLAVEIATLALRRAAVHDGRYEVALEMPTLGPACSLGNSATH